ncbi:hypothetical protein, partial [Nonomuraea sp. NPDC003201]
MAEALGDMHVVLGGGLQCVRDAQMQPRRVPLWHGPDDRLADQVVREAERERVAGKGLEQAEGLQRLETVETGLHVKAGGAREQSEVDIPADESGDPQHLPGGVVKAGHPVLHDIPHGERHSGPRRGILGELTAVGKEPGQLPYEERITGGTGVDTASDAGPGRPAGLLADQLRHLGRAEWAEPDPAMTRQPA